MYTLFTRLHFTNFVHPFYTLQVRYKTVRADCRFKLGQFLELQATIAILYPQLLIWLRLTYLFPRTPGGHYCILPLTPRPHPTQPIRANLHPATPYLDTVKRLNSKNSSGSHICTRP